MCAYIHCGTSNLNPLSHLKLLIHPNFSLFVWTACFHALCTVDHSYNVAASPDLQVLLLFPQTQQRKQRGDNHTEEESISYPVLNELHFSPGKLAIQIQIQLKFLSAEGV